MKKTGSHFGRCAGAVSQEGDGEPFGDGTKYPVPELREQQRGDPRLDQAIVANLKTVGCGEI